jgi:hypothetical protein
VADEIERKIYEALGVDPPGSLSVVEPPPDAEGEPGAEPEAAAAGTDIPEEQAA